MGTEPAMLRRSSPWRKPAAAAPVATICRRSKQAGRHGLQLAMQPFAPSGHLTCMTRAETADMSRLLLALSLFAFAALALANEPVNCDAPTAAKPSKANVAPSAENDTPTAQGGTLTPARAGTRPALPRWQSLLPGMIR